MPLGNMILFTLFLTANKSGKIKSTNKAQIDLLVSRMQESPDIARGFVKENHGVVAGFWKKLTVELNSAGPPEKNESEWKKVWNDQKRYVRKKASINRMHEKGTGGGPNKTQKLSQIEESIFQLIGMKEAVEGVGTSQSHGLVPQAIAKGQKETQKSSKEVAGNSSDFVMDEGELGIGNHEPLNRLFKLILHQSNRADIQIDFSNFQSSKKSGKMTTNEVVLKELEVQQELCVKVGEAVSNLKNHNKEIQYAAKKIYKTLERLEQQQTLQLEEMKRHNLEIEKLRKEEIESEIENARRLLELKEMKVELLTKNLKSK